MAGWPSPRHLRRKSCGPKHFRLEKSPAPLADRLADSSAALRLAPKPLWSHMRRGAAYRHKGDQVRASADFAELARLDPALARQIK